MLKIFITLLLLLLNQFVFGQSLVGTWIGDLAVPGGTLKFIIHIEQSGGVWSAKADSPQQGVYNIPSKITVGNDEKIIVDIQGGIKYNGKLENNNKLVGKFKHGEYETDLLLSNEKKELLIRSQRVVSPYMYDTLDVKFRNPQDDITLSGVISYPKAAGKYPAVILVSGSGPQDRNSTVFRHETFKVLADYLTKNNIVVLRYDDRGVGESGGNFNNGTIADFSRDALAALDCLKKDSRVNPKQIGIVGHSEGGLIAELLAGQQYPVLSFIVSLAGPTVGIDELMVEQLYKIGKVGGLSNDQLSKSKIINKQNFSILKSDLTDQEAYKALQENMKDIPGYSSNLNNSLNQLLAPSFRYFMKIEPENFIRKINIPVFAAFGSLDVQVDANQNIYGLQKNLKKNKFHKVIEYPNLNHLFQTASTGAVDEYGKIEETFNLQVMKDIADWINKITN